jgi:predicted AAA+ superfamily ATPase
MQKNPFSPAFGSVPSNLYGREFLVNDIIDGLNSNVGDPRRSTIITGIRGSGKTSLIHAISEKAKENGYIAVNVVCNDNMLTDIIQAIDYNAKHLLPKKDYLKIQSISAFGFGISFDRVSENKQKNFRTVLSEINDILQKTNTRLLITVDEVSSIQPMRNLADTHQMFVRENRELSLIMAGLDINLSRLKKEKVLTFLYRANNVEITPLKFDDVYMGLKNEFNKVQKTITGADVEKMCVFASGFAYLVQLIGFNVFRTSGENKTITASDVDTAIKISKNRLFDTLIVPNLEPLSKVDLKFLLAMSKDKNESFIRDIEKRLNLKHEYSQVYRRRLLDWGIIENAGNGKLKYKVPYLKDYINDYV